MSSSNRKSSDYVDNFPTPIWTIRRFFERFDITKLGRNWIEPSAGDGSIIEIVDEFCDDVFWTAVECRDTRVDLQSLGLANSQIIIDDFFDLVFKKSFDVAILNPPFRLGVDFIRKCREIADYVIVFHTLNFLGSSKRNKWLKEDFPDIYVIPDRVAHTGTGRTDSVYSAWFVWSPQLKKTGLTTLLDCTSKGERASCNARLERALDERGATLRSMLGAIHD